MDRQTLTRDLEAFRQQLQQQAAQQFRTEGAVLYVEHLLKRLDDLDKAAEPTVSVATPIELEKD